jgi:hypothetical protein
VANTPCSGNIDSTRPLALLSCFAEAHPAEDRRFFQALLLSPASGVLPIKAFWRYIYPIFSLFRPLVNIQVAYGKYIFSWVLDLLAGYGYRPGRSFIAYLFIIVGFASLYNVFGHLSPFPDAFVFSVASFHGRGFFPSLGNGNHPLSLHDPLVVMAAIEAVLGLIIEVSFIATFTQRFFGK